MKRLILISILSLSLAACEQIDHNGPEIRDRVNDIATSEVAKMLSCLPLEEPQLREVHDAVKASSENGYDEEYTMEDLFTAPGAGVGDKATKVARRVYSTPLKDLINNYLSSTKAGSSTFTAKDLEKSGLQLYWPWYDNWDGKSLPAITFDPGDGSTSNVAYKMTRGIDGVIQVKEIVVDESYASKNPVWIVNTNDDAGFTSVEVLRKQLEGGEVLIGGKKKARHTKADSDTSGIKTLVLKEFTMLSNYDSWLCGGSEFFVKCGSLENFTATTEEEMLAYDPSITDFVICVQRKDVGIPQTVNAILVSEWTNQLERCAFLILEDDGGTWTDWTAEGEVKIKSKTYGFKLKIPIRSRDDIVWRGTLSSKYFTKYSGQKGGFGDVEVVFDMLESD